MATAVVCLCASIFGSARRAMRQMMYHYEVTLGNTARDFEFQAPLVDTLEIAL
ncbi:hypothetical protein JG687_00016880 [Phytophthora cactorum]|uniref:Uncharacterized protein n=1 Tax=Phytophthora cactorum TaxID=29920 RepID=A0A8T1TTX9_9STRA|nr:hypothetical protein JG687_00016880 [Phytophthora cactorum]